MGFIDLVKARARADKKTIVLPESGGQENLGGGRNDTKEDIANLIIGNTGG